MDDAGWLVGVRLANFTVDSRVDLDFFTLEIAECAIFVLVAIRWLIDSDFTIIQLCAVAALCEDFDGAFYDDFFTHILHCFSLKND